MCCMYLLSISCVLPKHQFSVCMYVNCQQDEEKQNNNTTQYVLDATMRKKTHMM